ncbi:MAG: CAP domain-containing protein [bacterium]
MPRHSFKYTCLYIFFIIMSLILIRPSSYLYAGDAATVPFMEDFETGGNGPFWEKHSSGAGRIRVTSAGSPFGGNYHCTMDSKTRRYYALNELILTIDLADKSGIILCFYHKEYDDESHTMPDKFTGSYNADGVAISDDNITWYKVQGLTNYDNISSEWKEFEIDLDSMIASIGISYTSTFKIKFQQYDNYPLTTDGAAFDNIEVYQRIIDIDQDTLPDDWEIDYFHNLDEGPADDFDNDALTNKEEYQRWTIPTYWDTDGDQMPDGWEVQYGLNPFDHSDSDEDLDSDGITNLDEYRSQTDPTIAYAESAPFPFEENFEGQALEGYWHAVSSEAGRIYITDSGGPYSGDFHLIMDSSIQGTYALNELILTIDLANQSGILLSFYQKEFHDEDNKMPASFLGSHKSDGIAISADGATWYKAQDLTGTEGNDEQWTKYEINLDTAIALAQITYNNAFKIKFQQYDNYPVSWDGFAFDDIHIKGSGHEEARDSDNLTPEEHQLITLINQTRQENGRSPLIINNALNSAARRHARDMSQNNFLNHTGSDGSNAWERIRDAGFEFVNAGENIAAGYDTPEGVVNGWMQSTRHRDNILNQNFCAIGAGYAYESTSSYGHYWTLTLGCQKE